MELKKGGLLERITLSKAPSEGICETCGNLIKASDTALGCVAHDKLIMPEYPPYHGNCNDCKDWKKGE